MIRQQLTQKQQQKLSPLQIQQVKLLELSSLEIENRITQELEENPALEELPDMASEADSELSSDEYASTEEGSNEDYSLGDYLSEDDIPDYKLQQKYDSGEHRNEIPYSESESFQEYMFDQLRLKNLSEAKFRIGEYIIGNIDDDGYMRREPEALSDDLAFQYSLNVSTEEIEQILHLIQQLDPPGIGAVNLQQCLLIQLRRKAKTPPRTFAIRILEDYFELFFKKQFDKIIRNLNISEEEMKNSIREITLLNPKPGNVWESNIDTKMAQITPDFVVETINGELIFSMPKHNISELRINKEYGDLLNQYTNNDKETSQIKEAHAFVKQKIDLAQWFIDAIKQRNTTLRNTMLAIIDLQRDFFLNGDESDIKPMILKDIAERSGYDISTISRVNNSKYVQTNWGIFSLKFFFSESMTNDEGEEISTKEIKSHLKSLIDDEDKTQPFTDDALTDVLKKKGYDIARRTVAKYREQLNIPVARLRKNL
ncbi:MAG: RNA polymerase sigma-54 factor [Candidatus Ordinivivax streblomastigis]|uniref:RNA polymerase sigma-54 factor n=1 Tax=Candidatus Ordinivivax streblomastigis TaxID=2540710 RepID=A0A5M8P198_9BACT|nr:MAG: RNA polymerase sigma-54 factor [Candidatus Ordinivivax streblomastigis]